MQRSPTANPLFSYIPSSTAHYSIFPLPPSQSLREMNEALREDDFLKAYDLAAHLITIDMVRG